MFLLDGLSINGWLRHVLSPRLRARSAASGPYAPNDCCGPEGAGGIVRFRDIRGRFNVPTKLRFTNSPRRCYWCGRPFGRKLRPTREHLLPRSAGGGAGANLAAACAPCNLVRGTDVSWQPFTTLVSEMPTRQAEHLWSLWAPVTP